MARQSPAPEPFDAWVDVRRTGDDTFEAVLEGFEGRSFGGQTLGCAALAAARTVEERALHALHAWFLRPVPPEVPIALRVEHEGRLLCELPTGFVSLDQVVWVHRDLPWDDWRLVTTESDVAHAGRSLCRRAVHTRDGRLVASMLQEQLIPATLG